MKLSKMIVFATLICTAVSAFAVTTYTETVDGITWTYTIQEDGAQIGSFDSTPIRVSKDFIDHFDENYINGTYQGTLIPPCLGGRGSAWSNGMYYWNTSVQTAVPSLTAGVITVPETLGGHTVTRVDSYAFVGCKRLTAVVFPNTIKTIGEFAFSGCSLLTSVTIPSGVKRIESSVFRSCSSLTSVIIPSSVTHIGSSAFCDCSGLTSVTIQNVLTMEIDSSAFRGCGNLSEVHASDVGAWCKILFRSVDANPLYYAQNLYLNDEIVTDLVIPNHVTRIRDFAFAGHTSLAGVMIGNGVTGIGNHAFDGCSALTNLTIGSGVVNIGDYAFQNCSGLTDVIVPDGVTSIEEYAFAMCDNLMTVTIGNSVTNIDDYAFWGCSNLTNIVIGEGVIRVGDHALQGCNGIMSFVVSEGNDTYSSRDGMLLSKDGKIIVRGNNRNVEFPSFVTAIGERAFEDFRGLTSVIIPSSVTNIGNYAFLNCDGITSVTIADGVTSIGDGAFCGCSGLTSIMIPDSVTSIGVGAFSGCAGLVEMQLPNSVKRIGADSFYGCSGLVSITLGSGVTSIGDRAFSSCANLKSFFVDSYNSEYKADGGLLLTRDGSVLVATPGGLMQVVLPEVIRSIGAYAFCGCRALESLHISNSITNIGKEAFSECLSIKDVSMPAKLLYNGNVGIAPNKISISRFCNTTTDPLDDSYDEMVYDNDGSFEIDLDISGQQIISFEWKFASSRDGEYIAFSLDNSIQRKISAVDNEYFWSNVHNKWLAPSFSIPSGRHSAQIVFSKNDIYEVGEATTKIKLKNLASLFPDSYSTIANIAFVDNPSDLYYETFAGCSSLHSIQIPSGVTNVGDRLFRDCSTLKSVVIPDGVADLGNVFEGCIGLEDVKFEGNAPKVEATLFKDVSTACCVHVHRLSSGWNVDIPGVWAGVPIDYFDQIVVFDANGGEGGSSNVICRGDRIIAPTVSRSGYTFKSWSPEVAETVPAEDVTYTAQWEVNKYTMCFDANGGDGGTVVTLDYGTPIIAPEVTRDGYIFKGWAPNIETVPDHDVTFVAQWEEAFLYSVGVGGKATITGCALPVGVIVIPATIGGYSVVGIAPGAFSDCADITQIQISDGVTSIGSSAFSDCIGLTSVAIPDSVTNIGAGAFSGCSGLTNITIPNSVTSVGAGAFSGCSGLQEVTIPFVGSSRGNSGGVAALFGYIFGTSSYAGGRSAKQYYSSSSSSTFYIPSALRRVIITDESSFGYGAFSYCSGLTNITFSSTLTSIGPAAFRSCGGLTSVTIPGSVASIGNQAFDGCSRLANVHVADMASWCKISFGNYYSNPLVYANKFYMNGRLVTNLEIPSSVTTIGDFAFCKCSGLTSVTIPNTVTHIGAYAFRNCTGLTSITIPNSVTSIGNDAFYSCSKLVSVDIGDFVTSIGANAFENCSKLTSVTIPGLVTYIGSSALNNCSGLTNVVFRGNAPTMGNGVFSHVDTDCCVYVRRASSGWGVEIPGTWQGISIDYVRHNVTFDANGGNCAVMNVCVADGGEIGELQLPTRWGYAFKGWWTAQDGGEEVTGGTVIVDDKTLYAHWERHVVAVPIVAPSDGSVFYGDSCEVTITCATDGALIYYSDNEALPEIEDGYLYNDPFVIEDTTVIKAVAVFEGVKSDYVTATIAREVTTLNAVLDAPDSVTIASGPAVPWQPVVDESAKMGGGSARSGAIGNRTNTWLSATVEGGGTMSFWCKTSCEHDEDNTFEWDRLMIYTNEVEIAEWRMDGETDWTERTLSFGGGTNTVKWVYYKDRTGADGEDCAWVDAVAWTPAGAAAPIPAVADDADVATVNAAVDEVGFADAAVKEVIGGSAEEYNAFKTWVDGVKGATGDSLAGESAVVANAHAAAAYLLGAERLFENEPTVEIGELSIGEDESAGTTAMTVAVTVKDGEEAVKCVAEKVKEMFEATGDLGDWTGAAKLTPTVTPSSTDSSGKMTFVVTPGDGTAAKAFLRIRK